jgi:hypothetical protein
LTRDPLGCAYSSCPAVRKVWLTETSGRLDPRSLLDQRLSISVGEHLPSRRTRVALRPAATKEPPVKRSDIYLIRMGNSRNSEGEGIKGKTYEGEKGIKFNML